LEIGRFDPINLERVKKGLAPQRVNPATGNLESMHLHHKIPRKLGGTNELMILEKIWQTMECGFLVRANSMKYQKRTVGSFVKIKLDDTYHTYARILCGAYFAFYDCRTKTDITDMKKIASCNILFINAVYNSAVTRNRWLKVGKLPLESELKTTPPEFIQDQIDPTKFFIYEHGKIRPATREECEGLECAAVWIPEHIEDRIRDHYAGVPNKWVEELKIKK